MRLLIACPDCKLQYDATGRRVHSRFHCACGAVVIVERPRGHEADVVHCSGCGAAREARAKSCAYCGADFTIHETDLDTVCPGCLARVSDRARYCHHCATPLTAEILAGAATELSCPACEGRRLYSRQLPDASVTALECRVCAGFWVGLGAFHDLLDAEARRPSGASGLQRGGAPEKRQHYRKCPHCAGLMVRRHLGGGKSGVVIDVCGEHGLWFDVDELARALAWIRAGGLESVRRDVARLKGSPDLNRKYLPQRSDETREKLGTALAQATARMAQSKDAVREARLDADDLLVLAGGLAKIFYRLMS
jgi:DNA-directed RNA polymerase subunit RPC12/RpoP